VYLVLISSPRLPQVRARRRMSHKPSAINIPAAKTTSPRSQVKQVEVAEQEVDPGARSIPRARNSRDATDSMSPILDTTRFRLARPPRTARAVPWWRLHQLGSGTVAWTCHWREISGRDALKIGGGDFEQALLEPLPLGSSETRELVCGFAAALDIWPIPEDPHHRTHPGSLPSKASPSPRRRRPI